MEGRALAATLRTGCAWTVAEQPVWAVFKLVEAAPVSLTSPASASRTRKPPDWIWRGHDTIEGVVHADEE